MSNSQEFEAHYITRRVSNLRVMLPFQQQTKNDASNCGSNGNAAGNVWEGVLVGDVCDI